MRHIRPLLLALTVSVFAHLGPELHATLPAISVGETVFFSDEFTDNSNAWTNVTVVNGTGVAATGASKIDSGTWSPSILGDSGAITSVHTFSQTLNVMNSPISLYMRVRVDNPSGTADGTKFQIDLSESTGNRFFRLVVRDGSSGFIEHRNTSGGGASTATTSYNYTDNTTFVDFKITLTPGTDVNQPANAEAFRYNTVTASYDSIGISSAVDLDTGLFNKLTIYNRNGTNGGVYFDSVVVTTATIPEPAAAATLAGMLVLLGTAARRRRSAPRL